jgi:hypothetical protein
MRPLIEFDGSVNAHGGPGAVGLSLRGDARSAARGSSTTATAAAPTATDSAKFELLFSGVTQIAPAVPPILHAVRVVELGADAAAAPPLSQTGVHGSQVFRIEAREGEYLIHARAVQLHAAASAAFYAVLPPAQVGLFTRWGWSLLLSLLRVRPLMRLISRRRA